MIELREHQKTAVAMMRERIKDGVKRLVLMAPCSFGKCHAKGTRVVMADGTTKAVEDVKVGDQLLGPDGGVRNVLSLGRGREEMFRVVQRRGDSYVVNKSHILSLVATGRDAIVLPDGRRVMDGDIVAMPLVDFMAGGKTLRAGMKGWRPSEPIEFPMAKRQALPVPPYIMGAWIGDGLRGLAAISKPPCKLIDEWREWGRLLGCGSRVNDSNGTRCQTVFLTTGRSGASNPCVDAIRATGALESKAIPRAYLEASVRDRMELLAGLLDSDGHCRSVGYEFSQKDEAVIRDFAFLARSLGFACTIRRERKGVAGSGRTDWYWRAILGGDCHKIPCRDKIAQPRASTRRHWVDGIREIVPLGVDDYYGFTLDADHLYLLEDFTVAHNTLTAAFMAKSASGRGKRFMFICDRIELIDQASRAFDAMGIDHGIIQASHPRENQAKPVQIASIQTLAARRRRAERIAKKEEEGRTIGLNESMLAMVPQADVYVVDECHTVFSEHVELIKQNPEAVFIGLSATPWTKGLGKLYQEVVMPITVPELIDQGWLIEPVVYGPQSPDLSGVRVVAGEYHEDDLEKAVNKPHIVGGIVEHWLRLAAGEPTICFAVNVAHSKAIVEAFQRVGVAAEHIDGYERDAEARRDKINRFRRGEITILSSVDILSKGFDYPGVRCEIMARPTKSKMLFIQQVGRVMRIDPESGKDRALILDHAGNHERLGFVTDPMCTTLDDGKKAKASVRKEKEKPEQLPKPCPSCTFMKPAGVHKCPECGFEPVKPHGVVETDGELKQLTKKARAKATMDDKQSVYSQLIHVRREKGYAPGWAAHAYRELFGVWPRGLSEVPKSPEPAVISWLKARNIRRAKAKSRQQHAQ
jgi:superfamily II DNA or RNA helicase